jgi:taurine dioxygenase
MVDEVIVIPYDAPLGAEIRGIDLARPLSARAFEAIERAVFDHIVIVVRGQKLDNDSFVSWARRFGQLHLAPHHEYGNNAAGLPPEMELISNILKDGKPIGALSSGEATWHTDMSMEELPASITFLYAEEIPPSGGNTRFVNLCKAFEELPEALRRAIAGRVSVHDKAYTAAGGVRAGFTAVTDKTQLPGARHPIVRTHPVTGRKALFLGRMGHGYIPGLTVSESDALLDQLWAQMTRPELLWEHTWKVGDVLMWDNRQTAHSRGAFDPSTRRLLRRLTAIGERPV